MSDLLRLTTVALCLAACADPNLKQPARLLCPGGQTCPSGLLCQPSTETCVAELDAPAVTDIRVRIELTRENPLTTNDGGGPLGPRSTGVVECLVQDSSGLAGPPVLTTACGLSCALELAAEPRFRFRCTVDAMAPQGPCALVIDVADSLQNRASVEAGQFVIDTQAPPQVDVDGGSLVVLTRVPWGSAGTMYRPSNTVSGGPDAAPEAVEVRLRSGTKELDGVGVVGGAFGPAELGVLDSPTVEISSIDAAGNSSGWAQVRETRWVATLVGKVAGSRSPNPHRLEVAGAHGPALVRDPADLVEKGELDRVSRVDGQALRHTGAASWRQLIGYSPSTIGAGVPRAVYDPARQRIVRFGGHHRVLVVGISPGGAFDDPTISEWDGNRWVNGDGRGPGGALTPASRSSHSMVFDSKANRIIVHGGEATASVDAGGMLLADTWSLAGRVWKPLPSGPPLSASASFWETHRARLVEVGGVTDAGVTGVTWVFDGERWMSLDAGIPPRQGAAAVFDPTARRGWVFGGQVPSGAVTAELWSFAHDTWTLADGGSPAPSPRHSAQWAWDETQQTSVLFGGFGADGRPLTDVWEWNGRTWAAASTAPVPYHAGAVPPGVFAVHGATGQRLFNAGTGTKTVVTTLFPPYTETYLLDDGGVWRPVTGASNHRAYERKPGVVCPDSWGSCVVQTVKAEVDTLEPDDLWRRWGTVLDWSFDGGLDVPGHTLVEYGGAVVSITGRSVPGPSGGFAHSRLLWRDGGQTPLPPYDPMSQALAPQTDLQAATCGGQLFVISSAPVALALAFVAVWDGGTWTQPPNARFPAGLRRPLLVGMSDGGCLATGISDPSAGNVTLLPVFVWDTALGWVPQAQTAPSLLGAATADRLRDSVLYFGGVRGTSTHDLLFERGPSGNWLPVEVSDPEGDGRAPPPRTYGTLTYDAARRRSILIGGNSSNEAIAKADDQYDLDDTWLLSIADQRPAAYFRVDLSELFTPAQTQLTRLRFRGVVGAQGQLPDGGERNGLGVVLWEDSRWGPVRAVNAAGTLGELTFELTDPELLQRLVVGRQTIDFALVSDGLNGSTNAELFIDYLEATVEYRTP